MVCMLVADAEGSLSEFMLSHKYSTTALQQCKLEFGIFFNKKWKEIGTVKCKLFKGRDSKFAKPQSDISGQPTYTADSLQA